VRQYVLLVRNFNWIAIAMNSNRTRQLLGLAIMVLSGFEAMGQAAKESNLPAPSANSIAGAWKATATLADFGDIFQPHQDVRRRVALVNFKLEGDKWTGHSDNPKHNLTAGQEGWDGRRQFSLVRFSDNMLLIEFEVEREGRNEKVRIDAILKNGRLVGTWRNLAVDGAEVFAGGWEAIRAGD